MSKNRDLALIGLGAALAPRRTEHYSRTEIHEHRAPTDKSVKLLKEMEAAAREKVIASIPLAANGFEGRILIEREALSGDYVLSMFAMVNGKRVEAVVREHALGADSVREAMPKLRDAFAKELATEILIECFDKVALPRV